MSRRSNNRAMALMFLKDVHRRANLYADRLDPKRLEKDDPLIRALDGIIQSAAHALYVANSDWKSEDWSGEEAPPDAPG